MAYFHRQKTLIFPICFVIGAVSLIITISIMIIAITHNATHLWASMIGCWYGITIGILSFGFKYLDISDDEINNQLVIQFGYNLPCFCGYNKICIPYDLIIQYQSVQSKWYYPRGCRKCGPTLYFNAAGYGQDHCCHNGYCGCCLCPNYCKQRSNHDMIYLELQKINKIHCCIREVVISTDDRENLIELLNSKDIRMLQVKDVNENEELNNDQTTTTVEP